MLPLADPEQDVGATHLENHMAHPVGMNDHGFVELQQGDSPKRSVKDS
jgi:hypothetical protein